MGVVKCWGQNTYGQLGDSTYTNRSTPVTVQGIVKATKLVSGGKHSCVQEETGEVKCWGNNSTGQLGVGDTTLRNTPTSVTGLSSNVANLHTKLGLGHICVSLIGSSIACFGDNAAGELGDGNIGTDKTAYIIAVTED